MSPASVVHAILSDADFIAYTRFAEIDESCSEEQFSTSRVGAKLSVAAAPIVESGARRSSRGIQHSPSEATEICNRRRERSERSLPYVPRH